MPGNRVICSDMTGKWKPRRFGMAGNPRSEIHVFHKGVA